VTPGPRLGDPQVVGAGIAILRSASLTLYGTEDSVEHLELARRALGYNRIVIAGASYGTRAAYVYARRYPGAVRATVLLAPAPVSMSVLDSFVEDGRRSLEAVVADS
jgi:pimeloyl-ACP methyl ester carboxylesterase